MVDALTAIDANTKSLSPLTKKPLVAWPGLVILNLAANDLDVSGIKALAQALEGGFAPSLGKLVLIKNPQIGAEGAEAIAMALEKMKAPLAVVDLSSCSIGKSDPQGARSSMARIDNESRSSLSCLRS